MFEFKKFKDRNINITTEPNLIKYEDCFMQFKH